MVAARGRKVLNRRRAALVPSGVRDLRRQERCRKVTEFEKKQDMRYGENSHQAAAFYVESNPQEASVATARQIQGKAAKSGAITGERQAMN